jgi:hypothetical protein
MRYSEARGTLIYEKNLKSKISCQTPFKDLFLQNRQTKVTVRPHIRMVGKWYCLLIFLE